jgi:hypothetical protein
LARPSLTGLPDLPDLPNLACLTRPGLARPGLGLGVAWPGSARLGLVRLGSEAVKVEVPVRLVGFEIPNEFVVGYGLAWPKPGFGLGARLDLAWPGLTRLGPAWLGVAWLGSA